ncbi:hypothetical protein [Aromatoleum buckelii]|uniref:Uncharacterized protein n=1 Tax=Aromatoleum buckelii TaxID=200254 RepID=A0ABX1N261_9RHOO|nr:hypothetical protein [Aromatoleum buckelii]MCK0510153.1 hypothetical protein [Aromatoleum buckelii]
MKGDVVGIRERLQARDALFISFADLLVEVAKAEKVTEQEAAIGLCHAEALSGVSTRLRMHGYGDITEGGNDALAYEMDCAVHGRPHSYLRDAAQHDLNAGEVGFLCEEIAPALAAAGIAVPERLRSWLPPGAGSEAGMTASTSPKADRSFVTYIPRQWITLTDASSLLFEYNKGTQYGEWWAALVDAADSQQIQSGTWHMDRGEQPLSHADIRTWCKASGIAWPVPLPEGCESGASALAADLRAELDVARARIAELEHERAELRRKIEATAAAAEASAINSPTIQRIIEAVGQYPAWRATKQQEPNLKSVLDWQEKQQRDKGNGSRVAHVAHHVIAEHFGLKS